MAAPALCILMASCEQKSPEIVYKSAIVDALKNVEDKASADDAAKAIEEAHREYKKSKIDTEQATKQTAKRLLELRSQIKEKHYYGSEALNYAF